MSRRNATLVSLGILLSRITGLIRTKVIAHYLGQGFETDIWTAAFRIPNFLQNLLGEGALSASFIPSYARLLHEGREEEARRLAGALLALLTTVVAVVVLIGELSTHWLVALIVSQEEWSAEKIALTERLVRIFFPGAGIMVISAWCLGVLNSHRRFFLSYASPVVWNAAIVISILVVGNSSSAERTIMYAAWGAVLGSLLQVAVQWPEVKRVGGGIRAIWWNGVTELKPVLKAFVPNAISRGANQISAFIDLRIASWLPNGAVSAIFNAQVLYTLPVSLFGMAISAAELPEMSRLATGDPEKIAHALRLRLTGATQRLAFYIVPSAVGFVTMGGVIAAALLQGGAFSAEDSRYVWYVLAGSATGLLASTLGRLYSSTFYALHDTRTPLYCGIIRVLLTGVMGVVAVRTTWNHLGLSPAISAASLTASAGVAGWLEFALLRRELRKKIGFFDIPTIELNKLWVAALAAGAVGIAASYATTGFPPLLRALVAVPANATTYLTIAWWFDFPEAAVISNRIRRLLRRPVS